MSLSNYSKEDLMKELEFRNLIEDIGLPVCNDDRLHTPFVSSIYNLFHNHFKEILCKLNDDTYTIGDFSDCVHDFKYELFDNISDSLYKEGSVEEFYSKIEDYLNE